MHFQRVGNLTTVRQKEKEFVAGRGSKSKRRFVQNQKLSWSYRLRGQDIFCVGRRSPPLHDVARHIHWLCPVIQQLDLKKRWAAGANFVENYVAR